MSSLVSHLDPECQKALELARLALPQGQRLDVPRVLDALLPSTSIPEDPSIAVMASLFPEPVRIHESPPPAAVDPELKAVLIELRNNATQPVTPKELFGALMQSSSGIRLVLERSVASEGFQAAVRDVFQESAKARVADPQNAQPSPFEQVRRQRLAELAEYGTV